jgi:hypothetical protein
MTVYARWLAAVLTGLGLTAAAAAEPAAPDGPVRGWKLPMADPDRAAVRTSPLTFPPYPTVALPSSWIARPAARPAPPPPARPGWKLLPPELPSPANRGWKLPE